MKKLLMALMALTMVSSAFGHGHSMVRLDGCTDDGRCDSLDYNMDNEAIGQTKGDDDTASQTIALNYARSFGHWGVGVKYIQESNTTDGDIRNSEDNSTTTGLSVYYNMEGAWTDTCFFALHYDMVSNPESCSVSGSNCVDSDDASSETNITLEYGHRYALGKAMFGVQMHWSPSVQYTMGTQSWDGDETTTLDQDDNTSTALNLRIANFAATF